MIRITAVPRPLRTGGALLGVVALAGCGTQGAPDAAPSTEAVPPATQEPTPAASSTAGEEPAASTLYTDGTYTADGSYMTPDGGIEQIAVTITLDDDVVTAVEVTGDPQLRESVENQSKFIGGISDVVVGKKIDDLAVSKVAGSSLTSGGFNDALEKIKAEAAA